jgi:hypothetical protein
MTSEARYALDVAMVWAATALLVGSCVLAWFKGRQAERFGALLYFASALFDFVMRIGTGQNLAIVPELLVDALVAVGFLVLAIRYNSLWLGAAMMLKGVQLALHATHLTDESDIYIAGWNIYALSLNAVTVAISLTILLGTIASIRARRQAASEQPPAAMAN